MAESTSAGQSVNHFLSWWQQQLTECVPLALRNKLARARRPAMWSPSADRVWSAGGALEQSKPFLNSALAQRGGEVALVVGESNGFRRELEMPLAVQDRLQQVLAFELDRLTPLKPSELYYDFRVSQRNMATGTCTVELVAAPKLRVDPMLAEAKRKNIDAKRMLLAPSDADTSLDLFNALNSRADEAIPKRNWINPALVALCAALLIAIVALPLWQMRQYIVDLGPVEAKAKADAEVASVIQRQLEKQIGEYNLPLTRKHGAPLVVQLLDDLSKRLPDDTWAQSIEIRSVPNQKIKEVVIQGETGSGGKILQLMQESPMIKDPAFKATMTRVAANAERFHIAGEMVAAELPKALVLTDSAAIITVPVSPAPVAGAPVTAKAPGAATLTPPPAATPPTLSPPPTPPATADSAKKPPPMPPSSANGAPALSAPPAALERRS